MRTSKKEIVVTDAVKSNLHVFYNRGWDDRVNKETRRIAGVNDGVGKLDFRRGLRNLPPFTAEEKATLRREYRKGWFEASAAMQN